jgi:hypothetical protein
MVLEDGLKAQTDMLYRLSEEYSVGTYNLQTILCFFGAN